MKTIHKLLIALIFVSAVVAYADVAAKYDTTTGRFTEPTKTVNTIAVKTTTYAALTTDHILIGNHATVAFTITLPAASGNTGLEFVIKNKGAATVTIDATGRGQIDGANSVDLLQYQFIRVISDGTTWNNM